MLRIKIWFRFWYDIQYFIIPGGRDASGKLFGKGVVEMENGDIIAGMFKVLSMISCKVVLLIIIYWSNGKTDVDVLLLPNRMGKETVNLGSLLALME